MPNATPKPTEFLEKLLEAKHLFNDDLLIHDRTRQQALLQFPTISFLLDHPKLREVFVEFDKKANSAKRTSRRAGFWAVVLAAISLILAATEPIWAGFGKTIVFGISVIAPAIGIGAAAIAAAGVLAGKRKTDWLQNRLATERLRQLYFQSFARDFVSITECLSDPNKTAEFAIRREAELENLAIELNGKSDSMLEELLDPSIRPRSHVNRAITSFSNQGSSKVLKPIFDAYLKQRLLEQWGYANFKLKGSAELASFGNLPLRRQKQVLGFFWAASFFVLVVTELALLLGNLAGAQFVHYPHWHSLALSAAIIALASRTLDEGFALNRELERFREYRSIVGELITEFERTESTDLEKIHVMREMESESFEELRSFLRANDEASFVF